MSRRDRKRLLPRVSDQLEIRALLSAPQIPGNFGQILDSQFQPFGFKTTVGTQLREVRLRGKITIDVVNPFPTTGSNSALPAPPINSGLIQGSQFNGGGFHTVGLQFDHVYFGRGLTVSGFDNENPDASTLTALSSGVGAAPAATTLPALENRGLVSNSQFNDGGFGVLDRNAAGMIIAREGRVGLQWRNTRVRGPVDIGIADLVIQPGAVTAASAGSGTVSADAVGVSGSVHTLGPPGKTVVNFTTNVGQIRGSQFNDGGFGDIGMQWSNVAVGGHVGTSTNTLFIRPKQDDLGPITISNLIFGQRAQPAAAQTSSTENSVALTEKSAGRSVHQAAAPAPQPPAFQTTYTNSPTNSGRMVDTQSNAGGFGDVGLQWKKVSVAGSVTAVHNSLTVQPENKGQDLITVQGIQFPTAPPAPPTPAPGPVHVLAPDPPVIASDGDSVTNLLPRPSRPFNPFFPTPFDGTGTFTVPFRGNVPLVNSANNSGLIRGGQFSTGGFGDQGLQWQRVHVGGNVQLVHNSLSVHPEGAKLAGISVSDVSYGPPISPSIARHLAVLPYYVVSPGPSPTAPGKIFIGGPILHPPNNRWLTNQQLAPTGTDVFLQWNGIMHRRGVVLVHNIIKIMGVGEMTGPIILSNIRFPFRIPNLAPLKVVAVQPAESASVQTRAVSARATRPAFVIRNAANNSGILSHAQFSDGGFGDDGLQWRNVSVDGSVAVVHNTLAVDESSDLPPGDVPGPITISNVTFNSGALSGPLSRERNQILVSPPDIFQRVSSRKVNLGRPLPQSAVVANDATNSGIMAGGQLASGGTNHVFLQWQCVRVKGKVTVIDNVLSISVQDRPTGPITISNVTFA
jgi:hypothetical protein